MLDAVYVATAITFFVLMVAYVRTCDALGRGRGDGGERNS